MRKIGLMLVMAVFIVTTLSLFAPARAGAFICDEETGNCCNSKIDKILHINC